VFATQTSVDLLDQADILTNLILKSEVFDEYKTSKRKLQQNKDVQQLIRKFNKMKENYEEVQRFGKYHPNYTEVSQQTRELKRTVDLHEDVISFKKAEKDLEALLNEVSRIIADAVSPLIKVPTGNPFFDSMSCSGGCATGGGCGCG
jgi:cell fate (sporulation/competence/biofilm development) regulator YlbF (YheA/YmcA/DUF963 family)